MKKIFFLVLLLSFCCLYNGIAQNKYESVLKEGKWFKIAIDKKGIYKITFDQLRDLGFSSPANVRIFGNGGKALPVMNNQPRPDDLSENKIIKGSNYILFYAEGPRQTFYDEAKELFREILHPYSYYAHYFLTEYDTGTDNEIKLAESITLPSEQTITAYNCFSHHETNEFNLIKTGSRWFGEHFKYNTNYDFNFNFENIIQGTANLSLSMAVRSNQEFGRSNIHITAPGLSEIIEDRGVLFGSKNNLHANSITATYDISPSIDNFDVNVDFTKQNDDSEAWLDYICVNAERELKITGNQFHFRRIPNDAKISEFSVANAQSTTIVLDITDPTNISKMDINLSGSTLTFKANTETLKEYFAFNGTEYYTPLFDEGLAGELDNQNLHSTQDIDMIILTHSLFLDQANELAAIHKEHDNFDVLVVTNEQVYNEFSSGTPDAASIRDFARMVYDRGDETKQLKYLLLFGDGSYNNKATGSEATNLILTYQSAESLLPTSSFVTDDYYGLLSFNDNIKTGTLEIGVGRLPVFSADEADDMIRKIKSYINPERVGDWRNLLCFLADDADDNQMLHERDADQIAELVNSKYPGFNIEKIFLDAYPQVVTSAGETYPDVNKAVNNRMKKGSLIFNYSGHGSERLLTQEKVIEIEDINSWDNFEHLPVFITATCEFSRFDDVGEQGGRLVSAGEKVILNPYGGAIAMFTTTRIVYAGPNKTLNIGIYNYIFKKDKNGKPYRFGDIIRLAKNSTISSASSNNRNFTLLGDPALRLTYPEVGDKYKIKTTLYNNRAITEIPDTLKAFSTVSIKGEIEDVATGSLHDGFNGMINITVFDEKKTVSTLDNDGAGVFTFNTRSNIIYKGTVDVKNGQFDCTFIAPKDISYNYNPGKISYYAYTYSTDFEWQDIHGYFDNFVIGGTYDENAIDTEGPEIEVYCTDSLFVKGAIIDENPIIYANVFDISGINTTGNGIGHDITLQITGENGFSKIYVLNDYYQANLGDYQSGEVRYSLFDLEDGEYTAVIKVWDVFNNSATAETTFRVVNSGSSTISKVYSIPNPFTDETSFIVEHNQAGEEIDVSIDVFDITGQHVCRLNGNLSVGEYRSEKLVWNGKNSNGQILHNGMYIARILIITSNGEAETKQTKIILNR